VLADPAYDPYVISVGAADLQGTTGSADDTVAPFSDRATSGRTVDFVAPGVSIASLRDPGSTIDNAHPGAVVDTRFFRGSGTSQAAAVTSGAAALLLSAKPTLTPDKVKALLKSTATPLAVDRAAQGAGRLDVNMASIAALPFVYRQSFTLATGTGSLEQARGTSHVAFNDVELRGEQDIMGQPWQPSVWAPAALAGDTWTGGSWNGADWTGSCLCTPATAPWTGNSWDGMRWTGASWTGMRWTDASWSGASWTGMRWTGATWTGMRWTGASWTGATWTSSSPSPSA
jgi:serine protease AprX